MIVLVSSLLAFHPVQPAKKKKKKNARRHLLHCQTFHSKFWFGKCKGGEVRHPRPSKGLKMDPRDHPTSTNSRIIDIAFATAKDMFKCALQSINFTPLSVTMILH